MPKKKTAGKKELKKEKMTQTARKVKAQAALGKLPEQAVVHKGEFVELHYTGSISESGALFDTTDPEEAKARGVYDPKHDYGPIIVCVGTGQLVPGLDKALEGSPLGERTIVLEPEAAFGKKDPKLIKLMPTAAFAKQNIAPFPGLRVVVDGLLGTIVTVTGGRTVVDFNHPLAGKAVSYKIRLLRIVTDPEEKLRSLLARLLNAKVEELELREGSATIALAEALPAEVQEKLSSRVKELIPEIKQLRFVQKKAEEKAGEEERAGEGLR
mgnify:CR=1 FL=1